MNSDIFLTKKPFDDLEICSQDNISLYVSRGWLAGVSEYFRVLLSGGFSETQRGKINLSYTGKILQILFTYINKGYLGEGFIEEECLKRLKTTDEVCDFLFACNEYQLDPVKNYCEEYFSAKEYLVSLFNTDLLITIRLLGLQEMGKKINEILSNNIEMLNYLDYDKLSADDISFTNFIVFTRAVEMWSKKHDPTDEEIEEAEWNVIKLEFDNISRYSEISSSYKNIVRDFERIVRKFNRAPDFQLRMLKTTSLLLNPDP